MASIADYWLVNARMLSWSRHKQTGYSNVKVIILILSCYVDLFQAWWHWIYRDRSRWYLKDRQTSIQRKKTGKGKGACSSFDRMSGRGTRTEWWVWKKTSLGNWSCGQWKKWGQISACIAQTTQYINRQTCIYFQISFWFIMYVGGCKKLIEKWAKEYEDMYKISLETTMNAIFFFKKKYQNNAWKDEPLSSSLWCTSGLSSDRASSGLFFSSLLTKLLSPFLYIQLPQSFATVEPSLLDWHLLESMALAQYISHFHL